jgi:hypothetical protein
MEFNITLSQKEDEFINAYFEAIYFTQGFDANGVDIDEDCRREQMIDALCFFSRPRVSGGLVFRRRELFFPFFLFFLGLSCTFFERTLKGNLDSRCPGTFSEEKGLGGQNKDVV